MTVIQLFLYPVKSLAGLSVNEANLTERGFLYDRSWMIVDTEGVFISQRSHPKMALIKVAIHSDTLQLYTNEDPQGMQIPLNPTANQEKMVVNIWDMICDAIAGYSNADKWLGRVLSMECRLVYMPKETKRFVQSDLVPKDAIVSFADGYPYHILGTASLADLNSKLKQPVGYERFRPNIIVETAVPFEEDKWKEFSLGETGFSGVKPCSRCIMVNVDPKTTLSAKEPLKTLATYRKVDTKVVFGLNALWSGIGKVLKVGDDFQN